MTFDPAGLEHRIASFEEEMHAPDFWEDQAKAQKVSTQYSRAKSRLEQYDGLSTLIDDLELLTELASEEDGEGGLSAGNAAELERTASQIAHLLDTFEEQRLFNGEFDPGDAIVNIHPGAGGTESQDWAEMLLRMYLRWAQTRGFDVDVNEVTEGDEAGIKSATFTVHGENAYGLLAAERGVHRLVRMSPFDAANRRHTSFASLDATPVVDEEVEIEIDEKDLRVETYRASGAGGQHVNKTDSAVRITHVPTKTVVQCQNERSQIQNRETAMRMLRGKLLLLEHERREADMAREKGEQKEIGWGSQIRSYVMAPYTLVKDHRTGLEKGNVEGVLNGAIDEFIHEFLMRRATGGLSKDAGSE
ncbi:MAG: peptide chain release factor 2 [Thermoleophilia bacterium]